MPTTGKIRARDGLGPASQALGWLVPAFKRFSDCKPHYAGTAEFHAALFQAGFELLEAKPAFLADISLTAWIRRPR